MKIISARKRSALLKLGASEGAAEAATGGLRECRQLDDDRTDLGW